MTSDHVRRVIILLFIFNLVLIYQNWETGRRVDRLQGNIVEAVKVINEAKGMEKKFSDSHILLNRKLDNILICLENGCRK